MGAITDTRQKVHQLVDSLRSDQLPAVQTLIERILDAEDDEPLTPEDREALDRAEEWFKHNEGIPHEEVLAEFGLSAETIAAMSDANCAVGLTAWSSFQKTSQTSGLRGLMAKWQDLCKRVNGIGLFGVNLGWVPPPAEAVVARKAIRFLEDRRMLFNDCCDEDPDHCVKSALEIREFLTILLGEIDDEAALRMHLAAIRYSCRRFLDQTQGFRYNDRHWRHEFSISGRSFFVHLGEIRSAIGLQVAIIAAKWQIDVEGDLARVLPAMVDGDLGSVLRATE